MITVLHRGGYAQMITILHGGGRGGSLGTPKSDYVICARPLSSKYLNYLNNGYQITTSKCSYENERKHSGSELPK